MKSLETLAAALLTVTDSVFLSEGLKGKYPYIVYDFDSATHLKANNTMLEQALRGTVDLYSTNAADPLFNKIQMALRRTGFAWYFNTKQVENNKDKTVYHYEWVWNGG